MGPPGGKSRERRREMSESAREFARKTSGSDTEVDGGAAGADHVAGTRGAVEGETVLDRYLPSRTRPAKRRKTSRSSYRSSAPGRGSLPGAAATSKESTPSGLSTESFLIATSNCTTCGRRRCSRTGCTLPGGLLRGADRRTRSLPCRVATSPKWTTSAGS